MIPGRIIGADCQFIGTTDRMGDLHARVASIMLTDPRRRWGLEWNR